MNADAVRRMMQRECRRLGSQAAFARLANVHPQSLSLVLKGERDPTPAMLAVIGAEIASRVTTYRRVRKPAPDAPGKERKDG